MISILFENDNIIVIDKPAGLAVQPGAGVKISVPEAIERDYGIATFPVHRLDKETAGCLILAKSKQAASFYSDIISEHKAIKEYRAIVSGNIKTKKGVFTNKVKVKDKELDAETHYKVLFSDENFSIVEVEIKTGRMHQIRQHFAQAGYPLLGDDKYGNFKLNKELSKNYGLKHLMLYSHRLYLPLKPAIECFAETPMHFVSFYQKWGHGADI